MRIRFLPPGAKVPPGVPLRYMSTHGYIKLRWKVGVNEYVEVPEHRVFDGFVTMAEHVHHINHNRSDNRPENLVEMTASEHFKQHRRHADEEIAALYLAGGVTVQQIGESLDLDASQVSRSLKRSGVQVMRGTEWTKAKVDADDVIRRFKDGERPGAIADALGVSRTPIDRILREAGIPPHRPGRPRP